MNAVIETCHVISGKVLTIVDTPGKFHELTGFHLIFDLRVVEISLEHYKEVGESVGSTGRFQWVFVVCVVTFSETLHDTVHFLGFAWEREVAQETSDGIV